VSRRAVRRTAAALGMAAMLTKPFDLDGLVATIGRVLEQALT
jgi:DNA-binding response OmpR family regulator